MVDYYTLIGRAVTGLDTNTDESRRELYDRARAAQLKQLRIHDPPLSESRIERERLALEGAIGRIETEVACKAFPMPKASEQEVPGPDSSQGPPRRSLVQAIWGEPSRGEKIVESAKWLRQVVTGYFNYHAVHTGAGVLGIAMVALGFFVIAIFVRGAVWITENVLEYVAWLAAIAFAVCLVILLPLALFRVTRPASKFGFFVASYVFGAATWMFGAVATYYYLGAIWTAVGLMVLFVGILPLGMIGATIKSDWIAVGVLVAGLVLTYGSRAIAAGLAAKIDLDGQ